LFCCFVVVVVLWWVFFDSVPVEYLFSEEEILQGKTSVLVPLLLQMRKAYGHHLKKKKKQKPCNRKEKGKQTSTRARIQMETNQYHNK